uniref:Uncharacterized protein n=1 Tax=Thermosporothrix sp. COM3 TaxID=2490863 RepID=A0A455SE80_9CHLR|nr:hypothetical protein KTC_00230 [Thermosporothrix sp. COM3]
MKRQMMNQKAIERHLALLNDKLAEEGIKASILLVGGAYMVSVVQNRKTTRDIDVSIATNQAHIYRAVKHAATAIAQTYRLPSDWFNDDVTIVIDQIGRPQSPSLWKQFSHLRVLIPEEQYILALKLFAGREDDDRDIQALAKRLRISSHAQAWELVQRYIPPHMQSMRPQEIANAIERCFSK